MAWATTVREYCRRKLRFVPRKTCKAPARLEADLRHAVREGHVGMTETLLDAGEGRNAAIVRHLDARYVLGESRTRNALKGFLNNSMPPAFLEWCALALTTQSDYGWLDSDWLLLHQDLLMHGRRWQFIAYVAFAAKNDGSTQVVGRMREAFHDFLGRFEERRPQRLFPADRDTARSATIQKRCDTVLEILSSHWPA